VQLSATARWIGGVRDSRGRSAPEFGGRAASGVEPVFEGFFHAPGQLVDALLGGGGIGFGAEQGELDVSGVGEDGGFHVLVFGVDGASSLSACDSGIMAARKVRLAMWRGAGFRAGG